MEIAIPFNQAQEIALICRDELGLSVRYRALLHRRATRENPRLLDNICYDADEFLDVNLFDGQFLNSKGIYGGSVSKHSAVMRFSTAGNALPLSIADVLYNGSTVYLARKSIVIASSGSLSRLPITRYSNYVSSGRLTIYMYPE